MENIIRRNNKSIARMIFILNFFNNNFLLLKIKGLNSLFLILQIFLMYTKEQTRDLQLLTNQLLKSAISVEQLRDVLRFHEYRYYILNDPLISDVEYDRLYKALEKLEKDNPALITSDSPTQRVGNSLNKEFVTVPHLVPMLSLENSYNPQDLVDWDKRVRGLVDASHKLFIVQNRNLTGQVFQLFMKKICW